MRPYEFETRNLFHLKLKQLIHEETYAAIAHCRFHSKIDIKTR